MTDYIISCPCLFGLESVLASEVKALGGSDVAVTDGRVTFRGDAGLVMRANLWLRTAERVQLLLGQFRAQSFEELFEGVYRLPIEQYIGREDAFPVKGWSLNSQLHSIPDCQAIVKKAAVKRLSEKYGLQWFPETGPVHQLQFSILKDEVLLLMDTSGVGLHKRGYRPNANEAPIKETLAAGILQLARVGQGTQLYDPFCGSGTFLIEGALLAMNIAPGLRRQFVCEKWGLFPESLAKECRMEAVAKVNKGAQFRAFGSDIDPEAVRLTMENAVKAGVPNRIRVEEKDVAQFHTDELRATIVCNPPYGERLLEIKEAEQLYRTMGQVFEQRKFLNYYVISPHEEFERLFGLPADKRRKLYNGMIRCQLFMYFKGRAGQGAKPQKAN